MNRMGMAASSVIITGSLIATAAPALAAVPATATVTTAVAAKPAVGGQCIYMYKASNKHWLVWHRFGGRTLFEAHGSTKHADYGTSTLRINKRGTRAFGFFTDGDVLTDYVHAHRLRWNYGYKIRAKGYKRISRAAFVKKVGTKKRMATEWC